MVPKTYTLDLRLTADHFAVKRGFAAPTTFSADAEATFEILQDTSCLLLHAQVNRSPSTSIWCLLRAAGVRVNTVSSAEPATHCIWVESQPKTELRKTSPV